MLVLGAVSAALACAGLVHEEGVLAESGASEAIFERTDDGVAVTYEVVYEGDAADFGWVVPVPGDVIAVEDGDASRFEGMRAATSPSVWVESSSEESSGGGCFSGSAKSGGNDALAGSNDGVTVVSEGFTGTYGYTVVSATDATALQAWADTNGWALSSVAADLQHYLDRGDAIVLLDLHPDAAETAGPRALPPVRLRYQGADLRFPSVMARSGEVQRTTVYVAGPSRAWVSAGWQWQDLIEISGLGDAQEVFEGELAALGADRTWARTWSGAYDGQHLTRFDLLAEASAHVDDAVFDFDDSTDAQSLRINVAEGSQAAWVLPMGLLWLGRRRARG